MTAPKFSPRFRLVLRLHLDAQYGRQAELARHLGVTRQMLNGWLAGRYLPGHEKTLAILSWLSPKERRKILAR